MNAPIAQAIPEGSILLHVGMGKTGSSAMQGILALAHDDLLSQGVHYPRTRGSGHRWPSLAFMERAAYQGGEPPHISEWTDLVDRVRESTAPRIMLTSEAFSDADDAQCARLVETFGAERLHIVVTARSLAPLAVSIWQQGLKSGWTETLGEWLEGNFRRPDETTMTQFWWHRDPSVVVERWVKLVGADRVNVIVVDGRDHSFLPGAFEQLLGVRPGTLTSVDPPSKNRGMTTAEAELFRRVNVALGGELPMPLHRRLVRFPLIRDVVERRTPTTSEARLKAPAWAYEQGAAEGARITAAFSAARVRVIGDPDQLSAPVPTGAGSEAERPDRIPMDLAVGALTAAASAAATTVREKTSQEKNGSRDNPRVKDLTSAQLARVVGRRLLSGRRGRAGQ